MVFADRAAFGLVKSQSSWVELRGFEPLTFSLRRLRPGWKLRVLSVNRVNGRASAGGTRAVRARHGHTLDPDHILLRASATHRGS